MAKFDGFEEIQAWQKAYEVTLGIYRITGEGAFSKDFGLRDQIRRASVSIGPISRKDTAGREIRNSQTF